MVDLWRWLIIWDSNKVIDIGEWAICRGVRLERVYCIAISRQIITLASYFRIVAFFLFCFYLRTFFIKISQNALFCTSTQHRLSQIPVTYNTTTIFHFISEWIHHSGRSVFDTFLFQSSLSVFNTFLLQIGVDLEEETQTKTKRATQGQLKENRWVFMFEIILDLSGLKSIPKKNPSHTQELPLISG